MDGKVTLEGLRRCLVTTSETLRKLEEVFREVPGAVS